MTKCDPSEADVELLKTMLAVRRDAGLTRAQFAERMGISLSAVDRLLDSVWDETNSPTLDTLIRFARACGKKLRIEFV
jgi:transcriptional regulator with XRE-family HTH domain